MDVFGMRHDTKIEKPDVQENDEGQIISVGILFGPDYAIDVKERNGTLFVTLTAQHESVEIEASISGGDLSKAIASLKRHES